MPTTCTHVFLKPQPWRVRAEGSQIIIGEASVRVCRECCHAQGTVKTGSLYYPTEPVAFEAPEGRDIEGHARRALQTAPGYPVEGAPGFP